MTADGVSRLTPDMLLALVRHSQSEGERADCVGRHRPRDRRNSCVIRGQRHRQGAWGVGASRAGARGPGGRMGVTSSAFSTWPRKKPWAPPSAAKRASRLWQSATDMLTSHRTSATSRPTTRANCRAHASRPSMWSAYQTIRPSESKAGSRPFRTPRSGSSIFSCSSTCSRSKRIRCGGPRLPESLPRRSRDGRSRAMCRLRYRRHSDRARSGSGRARAVAGRGAIYGGQTRIGPPGPAPGRPASQGR